jgi:serine/threonine protein kinase
MAMKASERNAASRSISVPLDEFETHRTEAILVKPQHTLIGAVNAPPSAYRFLDPPRQPDEMGRLGNYRVLRLLGKGGMAYVFLAEDVSLRRRVALKVMKPELGNDPSAAQRFLREARTAAAIKHDHLVTVFQVGQQGGVVYLAMECLRGETLDAPLERGEKLSAAKIARLGREMALGLDAIHRQGLIHRDIKPNNIWLEDRSADGETDERVKLLDFGLARPVEDDARFTQSGNIVGTPAFMSPEQARGERIDFRSDLFSLGGVLYFLATGRLPFQGETTMAVLTALAIRDPIPLGDSRQDLPSALVGLIDRLLAKDPARRPASAREVADLLARLERATDTVAVGPLRPDQWDFSETEVLPVEPRSRPYAAAKKKAASRQTALTWGVAIGLGICMIAGIGFAINVALQPDRTEKTETPQTVVQTSARREAPPVAPKAAPVVESRKAYLSELKPIASQDWVRTPPQPKFGEQGLPSNDFFAVNFRGKEIPRGIFMHPPYGPSGGTSSITYRLGKKYESFSSQITLNDGPKLSETPIVFTVYGDDKLLWRSKPVRTQEDTQICQFSVKDVESLTIETQCLGDSRGAHAVWIDPMVAGK